MIPVCLPGVGDQVIIGILLAHFQQFYDSDDFNHFTLDFGHDGFDVGRGVSLGQVSQR